MRTKKFGLAAASTAAVAALLIGGATLANAADNPTPTTSATTSSAAAVPGDAATGKGGPQGASQDTPVTGDEATKVSAAVTAKDSTVTVESVRKDPDGSYDVLGTKAGAKVMFDVSADLATITENAGGPGGKGGASQDTPVTGDEAAKASAAVTAKDSTVTVESVRKDPDGSYDVLGTKAGAKVMFDVSADLATITENAGGPGGQGGHGPKGANDQQGQQAPASTSTATTN
jgi:hypothetical protein